MLFGRAGLALQGLGRRLVGIDQVEVGKRAARQALGRRQAGIGVFRRQTGHGHGALDQLGAGLCRDVGAGDGGAASPDEDAKAQIAGFLALDLLQIAEADRDGEGLALGENGLGRVGPGLARGGDHVMQQIIVHAVLWTTAPRRGKRYPIADNNRATPAKM